MSQTLSSIKFASSILRELSGEPKGSNAQLCQDSKGVSLRLVSPDENETPLKRYKQRKLQVPLWFKERTLLLDNSLTSSTVAEGYSPYKVATRIKDMPNLTDMFNL